MSQLAPVPTPPSEKTMVLPPSGALTVPPQLELLLAGEAIVIPAGNTSTKAMSSTGIPSGLIIVNVSVLTLPGPIVLGENDLENVGWANAFIGITNNMIVSKRGSNFKNDRRGDWLYIKLLNSDTERAGLFFMLSKRSVFCD
jgi:hypothetical protein